MPDFLNLRELSQDTFCFGGSIGASLFASSAAFAFSASFFISAAEIIFPFGFGGAVRNALRAACTDSNEEVRVSAFTGGVVTE